MKKSTDDSMDDTHYSSKKLNMFKKQSDLRGSNLKYRYYLILIFLLILVILIKLYFY